jgi:DNA-binding LytR/AlgR family response regulator
MLINILKKQNIAYEIDVFYNGSKLCEMMKDSKYDLIFLDIELPDINGITAGRYIREILHDEIIQIVYISSKQVYAMELFDFRPLNFLIKPLNADALEKVIHKYLIVTENDAPLFRYKKGFDLYKIPLAQILYFRSDRRIITVVSMNGEEHFYGKMDSVYSSVKNRNFLYIHKSVIVNYKYIRKFGYESVTMIDGTEFSISQSRRKAIRDMHMKIIQGENI